MNTSKHQYDVLVVILGLVGLIPTGLLALWAFATSADLYETALQQEYASCPKVMDCNIPQQCVLNISAIKQKYISELDGTFGILYRLTGYPTISVGYPEGTADKFLIPVCEP